MEDRRAAVSRSKRSHASSSVPVPSDPSIHLTRFIATTSEQRAMYGRVRLFEIQTSGNSSHTAGARSMKGSSSGRSSSHENGGLVMIVEIEVRDV